MLVPSVCSGQDKLTLGVEVFDAASGASLLTASETCAPADAAVASEKLVHKLQASLLDAMVKKSRGKLAVEMKAVSTAQKEADNKPALVARVHVDEVRLNNLFPSQLAYYQTNPAGGVSLRHDDVKGLPAREVTVSVFIPAIMRYPSEARLKEVAPGEAREVPVQLTLDTQKLLAIEENTPSPRVSRISRPRPSRHARGESPGPSC